MGAVEGRTRLGAAHCLAAAMLLCLVAADSAAAAQGATTATARPGLVYSSPGASAKERPLHRATIDQRARVGVSHDEAVRAVTVIVDPGSANPTPSVDRSPPFEVPRGRTGAYTLGAHTVRVVVELRTGGRVALEASYVVARVMPVGGTISADELARRIESAPSGPLLVRPAATPRLVVTGNLSLRRSGVSLERADLSGTIDFDPGSDGSSFVDGRANGFAIFGADDITIARSAFDGRGVVKDNPIWDQPAGSTPDRFHIIDNSFRNFYDDRGGDVHSQALFIGYSTHGLIEGNSFMDNGTTAHIFISYFGSLADPARGLPRNICIRGNWFGRMHGAWNAVNLRREITPDTAVSIAPTNRVSKGVSLISEREFLRPC
jgi:hypothetical protein